MVFYLFLQAGSLMSLSETSSGIAEKLEENEMKVSFVFGFHALWDSNATFYNASLLVLTVHAAFNVKHLGRK